MNSTGSDRMAPDATAICLRVHRGFALLVALVFPALLALGFWQLERADQKTEQLATLLARRALPAVTIGELIALDSGLLDRRSVRLRGHYQNERSFLLDNRVFRGRVGYEVITPFLDVSGSTVLLNRGWLQAMRTREQLPVIASPQGELSLRGEVYAPADQMVQPQSVGNEWPRRIQTADVQQMGAMLARPVFPGLVLLAAGETGATEAVWPPVNILPVRHIGYAVQWFLMAAALLLVFVCGGTTLPQWLRQRGRGPVT